MDITDLITYKPLNVLYVIKCHSGPVVRHVVKCNTHNLLFFLWVWKPSDFVKEVVMSMLSGKRQRFWIDFSPRAMDYDFVIMCHVTWCHPRLL